MVDVFCALITAAHHNLFIVVQVLFGYLFYITTHRGREHQGIVLLRQRFEDLVDILREAHVQHLVSLVEDNVLYLFQMDIAAMHEIDQSSRGRHDNLHTLFQGTHLRLDGSTAVDSLHMDAIHVFGKVADVVGNL